MQKIVMDAFSVTVPQQGSISTNGKSYNELQGTGSTYSSSAGGASHGGSGGGTVLGSVGLPYGSHVNPFLPGCSGGSSASFGNSTLNICLF